VTAAKNLHASSVSIAGQAVLITGASGTGKSTLALELLSRGAALIADDQTILTSQDNCVIASAPAALAGQIEARGIGILAVEPSPPCPVRMVVNLDNTEDQRLPDQRYITILGIEIDLVNGAGSGNLAAVVLALLKGGRIR